MISRRLKYVLGGMRGRRISTLSVYPPVISGEGTAHQIQRQRTILTHGTPLLAEWVHRSWQERSGKKAGQYESRTRDLGVNSLSISTTL